MEVFSSAGLYYVVLVRSFSGLWPRRVVHYLVFGLWPAPPSLQSSHFEFFSLYPSLSRFPCFFPPSSEKHSHKVLHLRARPAGSFVVDSPVRLVPFASQELLIFLSPKALLALRI
jgi:hypothetical protein